MITRRDFNLATLAIGGGALAPRAFAQEIWPARLIKFVVPFPPGGANDVIGRIMADKLSKALNATVVVEKQDGAGGTIGAACGREARSGRLEAPELSTYLSNEGALATRSSPEEFQSHIKAEIARWRKVIIDAGIPRASWSL
jgi:tripartite-type tricarboxylate transporter receptor subunit TctC